MKNKKNYYIVRFMLDGECINSLSIKKSEARNLAHFIPLVAANIAGGATFWYDIHIDSNQTKLMPNK
jgi:hypothetical protein